MIKKIDSFVRQALLLLALTTVSVRAVENTQIFSDVFNGNLESVQQFIEKDNGSVEITNELGNTLLHVAASLGKTDIVTYLLEQGANVLRKNKDGKTARDLANDVNIKQLLKDADTKYRKDKENIGWQYIHFVVDERDIASLINLLAKKVPDSMYLVDNNGLTPLHLAAKNGDVEIFKLLVDGGVDITSKTATGPTVLGFANDEMKQYLKNNPTLQYKNLVKRILGQQKIYLGDVQKVFESAGDLAASVKGFTLVYAASRENLDIGVVKWLVDTIHVSIDSVDEQKMSALHWAAKHNDTAMLEYLIGKGANLDQKNNKGKAALHWAAKNNNDKMLEYLIDKGANIGQKNNKGKTALHWVAKNNNTKMLKCLIDKGANIEQQNNEGKTAFDLGDEKTKKLLLDELTKQYVAKIEESLNNDNDENIKVKALNDLNKKIVVQEIKDIFWRICFHKAAGIFKSLDLGHFKEAINDLNITDANGDTAMHHAARGGNLDVMKALVGNNAKSDLMNKKGYTPLHVAIEAKQQAVVEYLLSIGVMPYEWSGKNVSVDMFELGTTPEIKKMLLDKYIPAEYGEKLMEIIRANSDHDFAVKFKKEFVCKDAVAKYLFELAIIYGRPWVADFLIDGENIKCSTQASNGQTALHSLILNGQLDDGDSSFKGDEAYNKHECSVNIQDKDGVTPLHLAILMGKPKLVKALIDNGADCTITDGKGRNIFHFAAWSGNSEVVKILIDKLQVCGSAVIKEMLNKQDLTGWTPMQIAQKRVHSEILTMWKDYGKSPGDMSHYALEDFGYYSKTTPIPEKVVVPPVKEEQEIEINEKKEQDEEVDPEEEDNNQKKEQGEEADSEKDNSDSGDEHEEKDDQQIEINEKNNNSEDNDLDKFKTEQPIKNTLKKSVEEIDESVKIKKVNDNQEEEVGAENNQKESFKQQEEVVVEENDQDLVKEINKQGPNSFWPNLPAFLNQLCSAAFGFYGSQLLTSRAEPDYLKKRVLPASLAFLGTFATHLLEKKQPGFAYNKPYLINRFISLTAGAFGGVAKSLWGKNQKRIL